MDLTTGAAATFSPSSWLGPGGDVNGDGWQDAVVAERCHQTDSTALTVVAFGPLQEGQHQLREENIPGFRIEGEATAEEACHVSNTLIGDINGDGLDDVVLGAPLTDHHDRSGNGAAYVVFGKTDEETVLLSDFDQNIQGGAGYLIEGPHFLSLIGRDMAGAGDINGDGLADLILGSPWGTTYVVFGKQDSDRIDLATFDAGGQGEAGYLIRTRGASHSDGYSVGAAGDVNADGVPDVVIGSVGEVNQSVGRAYVVFGKADSEPIDGRRLRGSGKGFKIVTLHRGDSGGRAVSGAGDVNGDGRDDVLLGVPRDTNVPRGLAFVVFGKKGDGKVRLAELGRRGFKIKGAHRRDATGNALAAVGDINRDGLGDVLVGARRDRVESRGQVGAAYLVYGKRNSEVIRLGRLTRKQGVRFIGREGAGRTGSTVAGPGDMNDDGIPDIMIGAISSGHSDIVWGLSWE